MNELDDISSIDEWIPSRSSMQDLLCWYCKINNRELISPCECKSAFIHVYCLELLVNTRNMFQCPYCHVDYPLEIQRKSFLKMLQKACIPFFMILFAIISNFMIGLIVYIGLEDVLSIDNVLNLKIIIKIIMTITFIWFGIMTINKIIDWSKRIYQFYYQWHKNEWKLTEEYNIQNIEETQI